MIVYTGKQFGNDFNNGDEGLFQDVNRPRDNNKFKIRPGLQSDKWKQRDANKDIYTEAASFIGQSTKTAGAGSNIPDDCTIATLTEKYKAGNPGCIIKDGNLVIQQSGTYILQAFTQFIISGSLSYGYQYVHSVALLRYKNDKWNIMCMNQGRFCGTGDQIVAWDVGWFNEGEIFNVGALHTYGSTITLYQVLNVQRLV